MRFSLFYEHQIARPWSEGAEERLLQDALTQIELADALGFHAVWEVEHHFLEEYSHSSAPEVFLAAASQRTKRIRLGHGIVQLPGAINHPARVAERVATLDLLSGGRVELGTGEGASQAELGGFGVSRADKRAQWEEGLDCLTRMLVEDPFAGWDGPMVQMPPRAIVPRVKQRPHPPLWVACSRRDSILAAARKGLGALSFSFIEPERAREWVADYYQIIASEACVPAGFAVNPNVAVVVPLMCHEDEATAIERGIDGAHFFGYALSHYYTFGMHRPGRTDLWQEFLAHRRQYGFAREIVTADAAPLGIRLMEHGLGSLRGAIGTPDQIAALVERYAAAGVDEIIFLSQSGHTRHEHICESLRLFAREVMPRFEGHAQRREAEKRARLAPACAAALARRAPPRVAPAGYVIAPTAEPTPADALREARRRREGELGGLSRRLERAGARLLRDAVARQDDARLAALLDHRLVLAALFEAMARTYIPGGGRGFQGEVEWRLRLPGRMLSHTLAIDGKAARVKAGPADAPALRLTLDAATFARTVVGEVHPGALALDGRLQIDGDPELAALLGTIFQGSIPT